MAISNQIKGLIKAHFDKNDERFKTILLQLAAEESSKGHKKMAREYKDLLDKSLQNTHKNPMFNNKQIEMFDCILPNCKLSELVINECLKARIKRIVKEYKNKDKLAKHNLSNRRKILIDGPSGTGKTMTASIIATELNLPMYFIRIDKLVTKYMGETNIKLRMIFDMICENEGVYLFDEFDAIGSERTLDNDVGEMRRTLNFFLQLLEQDCSNSIIIATTNIPYLLDKALFRRFDDVLHYCLPTKNEAKELILNKLSKYIDGELITEELLNKINNLSHAEITKICDDTIKQKIINEQKIDEELLIQMITERNLSYVIKEE